MAEDLAKGPEREGRSLFLVMQIAAWAGFLVGVALCLVRLSHFSDNNTSLMAGIGFLVGSVFVYIIGTAMNLVHKRKSESGRE
ncbi:hypothetical protein COLU111180_18915 [Cohnella lubricantis]|uniref:Uncharacterized protein n=1 Tax=Cohnella lubricantis TaxID=2163172 RepID=A0A841T9R5_9BACL|nr:hypothetical protein [Cohnella lubricantis]MBB6678044.1 hypothetical protein [Cohnella lubricantis]MBP2120020.1 putative membrane protein YecN with MAPEG domain [Cohnella lubricantis]